MGAPNASSSSFVAGHYTATYGGESIGTTEEGFYLRPQQFREDIRIDDFGDSIVDGIYRGFQYTLTTRLSEWVVPNSTGVALLQNFVDATDGGIVYPNAVGQPVSAFAKRLILTPVPNVNSNLKTYEFPLCVPNGDHGGFNLNTKLRRLEVNLLILVDRYSSPIAGRMFTVSS